MSADEFVLWQTRALADFLQSFSKTQAASSGSARTREDSPNCRIRPESRSLAVKDERLHHVGKTLSADFDSRRLHLFPPLVTQI
jgi:hypothetical protein